MTWRIVTCWKRCLLFVALLAALPVVVAGAPPKASATIVERVGPVGMTTDWLAAGYLDLNYDGTYINAVFENLTADFWVDIAVKVYQCPPNGTFQHCGNAVTYNNPANNGITHTHGHVFVSTVLFRAQGGHKYYATTVLNISPWSTANPIHGDSVSLDALPKKPGGRWMCIGTDGRGFDC